MNDEQIGPVVSSWLKEENRPPSDPAASVHTAMNAATKTRQLRRWWWPLPFVHRMPDPPTRPHAVGHTTDYKPSPIPATNGQSPTVIGRTQSMLSPVKAITAGAIVFALGGAFLVSQPFDQQGSVPGAQGGADEPVASFFRGDIGGFDNWTRLAAGTTEERADGVVLISGEGYTLPFDTNDPRITGTLMMLKNEEDYREGALDESPTGEVGAIRTGLLRIDNENGSWSGTGTNLQLENPYWEIDSAWLTGSDAYDGLMAYVVFDGDGSIYGYITPSGPPPAPESLPE